MASPLTHEVSLPFVDFNTRHMIRKTSPKHHSKHGWLDQMIHSQTASAIRKLRRFGNVGRRDAKEERYCRTQLDRPGAKKSEPDAVTNIFSTRQTSICQFLERFVSFSGIPISGFPREAGGKSYTQQKDRLQMKKLLELEN